MGRRSGTVLAVVAATLVVALPAHGAEAPTRETYVAAVEPICQRDVADAKRILDGTREDIREGRLGVAGGKLIRASERFGVTIGELVAVPRPAADEARLQRWFGFLRAVKRQLRKTGKFFQERKRLQATHESIRAEMSGNNANNASIPFHFRHCRLSRSRLG